MGSAIARSLLGTAIRQLRFPATNDSMQSSNSRTPPPITFRQGVESDFSPCAELWMHALAARDSTPRDPQAKRRALEKLTGGRNILFIAESASRILGFAMATDCTQPGAARTAHLTLLAVDPESQSQGLGKSLLTRITNSLAIGQFAEATLRVLAENPTARRIYESTGWQPTEYGIFDDSGRPFIRYVLSLKEPIS
ncbi:UNVERIFIED_CONTAM: ribosomal protein S18 acetylase RimI-like enzyme [Jeotgalibacillus campisalis]